ncbi:MAG: phosphoribosylglycinamide formyltransferase [Lachnospiraceae bacterium]
MLKVLVCVSGGGTNLQAIIDGIANGVICDTEIIGVLSNNKNAYALERARQNNIPEYCVSPKEYSTREEFNEQLLNMVEEINPDLIVLAGFLVTIPAQMTKRYNMRIINVHPSLIPAFCGVGYYGLKVHEKAIERGVKITGATVHFVDEGTDTGPILFQKEVYVDGITDAKELQQKVMEEAEWIILPKAIDYIAKNREDYI